MACHARASEGRDMKDRETGSSLSEIVMAIVILGAVIGVLMSAIVTASFSSRTLRQLVTQDTVMRSYAEAVKASVRQSCVSAPNYTVTYTPPAGYSVNTPLVSQTCPLSNAADTIAIGITGPNGPKSMQI